MVATQQRLGALLVDMGFIDDAQLASALEEQQRSDKRLGRILVEASVLSEDRLVHALSRQLGIEACDPIMTRVHERVLALIPAAKAYQHRVLPVARQRESDLRDVVYVATADPLDQEAFRAVTQILGDHVRLQWMLAGETEMELALARHYGPRTGSIPEGTKVITGVPVAGPSRAAEAPVALGTPDAMPMGTSGDDVLMAVNEALSDAPTTVSDRRQPSVEFSLRDAQPIPVDEDAILPLPAHADASTEEILVADEVVIEGDGLNVLPGATDGELALGSGFDTDTWSKPVPLERAIEPKLGYEPSSRLDSSTPSRPLSSRLSRLSQVSRLYPGGASAPGMPLSEASSSAVIYGDNVLPPPLDPFIEPGLLGRSDDITDELPAVNHSDDAADSHNGPEFELSDASWGDLVGREPQAGLGGVGGDARADDTQLDLSAKIDTLAALRDAAESMPIADPHLLGPPAAAALSRRPFDEVGAALLDAAQIGFEAGGPLPAVSPFPPFDERVGIVEPDHLPDIDIDEVVDRLTSGVPSASHLPAPQLPADAAKTLQEEFRYFVSGGAIDLSTQQRLIRAMAAVLMREGLLDASRLEAILREAIGRGSSVGS